MAAIEVESSFAGLHDSHQRVDKILSRRLILVLLIIQMIINDPLEKCIKDLAKIPQPATRSLKIEGPKIREIIAEIESGGLLHRLPHHFLETFLVQIPIFKLPPKNHHAGHISSEAHNTNAHIHGITGFRGPFERAHQEPELGPSHGLELADLEVA